MQSTHVKKVDHISEFPFGIYCDKKKKKCWRYHRFTQVYQKPQSYEVYTVPEIQS